MTKALRKAIMKRSELQSKYVKNRILYLIKNKENKIKKERKKYYERLDLSNVIDNKKIWKTLKLFFYRW